jgi:hypothetical protein
LPGGLGVDDTMVASVRRPLNTEPARRCHAINPCAHESLQACAAGAKIGWPVRARLR